MLRWDVQRRLSGAASCDAHPLHSLHRLRWTRHIHNFWRLLHTLHTLRLSPRCANRLRDRLPGSVGLEAPATIVHQQCVACIGRRELQHAHVASCNLDALPIDTGSTLLLCTRAYQSCQNTVFDNSQIPLREWGLGTWHVDVEPEHSGKVARAVCKPGYTAF